MRWLLCLFLLGCGETFVDVHDNPVTIHVSPPNHCGPPTHFPEEGAPSTKTHVAFDEASGNIYDSIVPLTLVPYTMSGGTITYNQTASIPESPGIRYSGKAQHNYAGPTTAHNIGTTDSLVIRWSEKLTSGNGQHWNVGGYGPGQYQITARMDYVDFPYSRTLLGISISQNMDPPVSFSFVTMEYPDDTPHTYTLTINHGTGKLYLEMDSYGKLSEQVASAQEVDFSFGGALSGGGLIFGMADMAVPQDAVFTVYDHKVMIGAISAPNPSHCGPPTRFP